jgi:hypothetical protein
MTVTFLVALEIDDVSDLPALAEDIWDDLGASGHSVQSVKPWARPTIPTAQPAGGFTSLNDNPPSIQPPL